MITKKEKCKNYNKGYCEEDNEKCSYPECESYEVE